MMSLPTPLGIRRSPRSSGVRRLLAAWLPALVLGVAAGCTPGDAPGRDAGPAEEATRTSTGPAGSPTPTPAPAPRPGTAWVIFGADTVVAEVAATPREREEGLMFRDAVPDGTGMLFVFEQETVRSFWMQNTFVDLDIAFMDAGFRVVDIQRMEAESTDFTESAAPALYALEVRAGWFAEAGVEVGDVAQVRFGG